MYIQPSRPSGAKYSQPPSPRGGAKYQATPEFDDAGFSPRQQWTPNGYQTAPSQFRGVSQMGMGGAPMGPTRSPSPMQAPSYGMAKPMQAPNFVNAGSGGAPNGGEIAPSWFRNNTVTGVSGVQRQIDPITGRILTGGQGGGFQQAEDGSALVVTPDGRVMAGNNQWGTVGANGQITRGGTPQYDANVPWMTTDGMIDLERQAARAAPGSYVDVNGNIAIRGSGQAGQEWRPGMNRFVPVGRR